MALIHRLGEERLQVGESLEDRHLRERVVARGGEVGRRPTGVRVPAPTHVFGTVACV